MMTKQLAFITLAAFLTALSPIEFPTAQGKQLCSSAMPSKPQGHWWSYRLIDGRKCWYEGKPGLSKLLLEWPKEASAQPASGEEIVSTATEEPRSPLDSQAWAPSLRASVPTAPGAPADPDTFETQWGARATVETQPPPKDAASVTLWPVAPEDGDGPALKKADKLQSPYLDSNQPKSVRTLVIIPDRPLPAQTSPSFRHP